ncbi:unnamed protein product, partial [Medioppia subpectinata]
MIVVNRAPNCNQTSGQCGKAAIIRGETHIGMPAVCYQRVDPGPCGRDLIRVYYDARINRCIHFSFSGCGGNANRFVSIKNCYHICNPGLRTRRVTAGPVITTTEKCFIKKKVKLNVTSVQQIEVE